MFAREQSFFANLLLNNIKQLLTLFYQTDIKLKGVEAAKRAASRIFQLILVKIIQMKKRDYVSQRGYSLIEMLIVLTITTILVSFAVARFGSAETSFKRQNISRELKVNLERARSDSVKRRAEVTVAGGVTTDTRAEVKLLSATSFTVKTDVNQNGRIDASDAKTIDFNGQSNTKITDKDGKSLVGFPITIKFDRYGRIEAKDSANNDITPLFTVINGSAGATAANADVIYVSPSGTVAMLKGGEGKPKFDPPGVSVVPSNTTVNDDLRLNSSYSSY